MPTAAPRYCAQPGCPILCQGTTRCPAHTKQNNSVQHRAYDARRGTRQERGYDSTWQRLRALKLHTDPMCEIGTHCKNKSITERVATEVDHIIPIRERPDLRLEWSNLQSACTPCHSAKTRRGQ